MPSTTQSGGHGLMDQTPIEQQHGSVLSPFTGLVVEECLQSMQHFRGSKYSCKEVIYCIFDSLGSVNQPMPVVYQAACPYINMLDHVITEQRGTEERSHVISGAVSQDHPVFESEPQAEVEGLLSLVGRKCHHAEPDDSDNKDDQHGGHCPLDLSLLPWMQNVQGVSLPQSLEDTWQLLVLFAQDLKHWKTYFINEPNCLQFPDSEWGNLVIG
ncbi:hypothetical protein EWM64_g2942 [Hericium alpestre]|uniref:Uncharacterized protein n=1 Tax=Hericium alpestre TaxID=135208 RepID=A0A4Z0A1Y1_9AGAM|nr:hypothetical protein EWM64_g2942 [Hericium alpestre]